ncbi:MAG: UvrD-helicase domain-containing protein [Bacteroidales bacterium]|jgi:ATP-dependent exoDNAse (exonuclease V) beta subunit|nr:UvrD-helicase domain-containing protein [Bacteroidales bacterium]
MNENKLQIYLASAGSGKTFNLVVEYLDLLMKNPESFKNILAVTFTNASTKEMKDRIVEVLLYLSNAKEDEVKENSYYKVLQTKQLNEQNKNLTVNEVKQKTQKALRDILHNYSFFNILTIDSFFQLILRNLAKEIGINSSFNLVIDDSDYNKQAVENLIKDSGQKDKEGKLLKDWLYEFFRYQQENNKSWNFKKTLLDFTKELQNKFVRQHIDDEFLSLENLGKELKRLEAENKKLENELEQRKKEFFDICKKEEIDVNDNIIFYNKSKGIHNKIKNLSMDKDCDVIEKSIEEYNNGTDYLSKGTSSQELVNCIENINNFFQESYFVYHTRKQIIQSIYPIGVLSYISKKKNELLKEDNVFVLSNTEYLLSFLTNNDLPFVYEKIGQIINNVMIDEFQDTNTLSWQNFNILIQECLSSYGKAFVFGDIKQSIYRFREGDWRILNNLVEDESNKIIRLEYNFRTLGNIVEFNNGLFSKLYFKEEKQKIKQGNEDKGSVRIKFLDKETEDMYLATKNEIDYYLEKGYQLKDITILCRDNKYIIDLANRLKQEEKQYNPISDVAFLFSCSKAVNTIICALRYLNDKSYVISKEFINENENLKNLETIKDIRKESLLELVVKLAKLLNVEQDTRFLPAFYDKVQDFMQTKSEKIEDFLDYWDRELNEKTVENKNIRDCLQITSIHKSKGLEYNVVIVPYCNWEMQKTKENIWIYNIGEGEKLTSMPIINASVAQLSKTIFQKEREEELYMQKIDNINLSYVAFTRSKKHLSIISSFTEKETKDNKKKEDNKPESDMGKILHKYIITSDLFSENEEGFYLYKGKDVEYYEDKEKSEEQEEVVEVKEIDFKDNALEFSSNKKSKEYFQSENESKRHRGTILHNLLSKIKTENDRVGAINKIKNIYKTEEIDEKGLNNILNSMFLFAKPYRWFDGTMQVMNERSIINIKGEEKEKRPDRIMIKDDEVVVVDYKFAQEEEKSHQKYIKQVNEYRDLLQEVGYKNVKCFLWYIPDNEQEQKIIEVQK